MASGVFQSREPNIAGNARIRTPQREAYEALHNFARNTGNQEREVGIVLPVGCGKTGCITLAPFAFKSTRTLVVAPSVPIAGQLYKDFDPTHPEMFAMTDRTSWWGTSSPSKTPPIRPSWRANREATPVIRPCDWQHALFGKLRATPPDGKPITTFANQHEAFLAVTKDIRKAAEELRNRAGPQSPIRLPTREVQQPITVKPDMRSSNLRLKKPFSDHERDQFLDEAFEYMARFFEGSLLELGKRNAWIEGQFKRIDTNHFTAAVYANGTVATRCKIWLGGRDMLDGILYSTNDLGSDTSFNGSLRVEDDGYSLFLKPLMAFQHRPETDQLTMQGAAEYYWSKFIERLQT